MFKSILVAIDGSDAARRALETAIELASMHNAKLFIAHIYLHGKPAEELERLAEIEHLAPEAAASLTLSLDAEATSYSNLFSNARHEAQVVSKMGDLILLRAKEQALKAGVEPVDTYSAAGDYADGILDAIDETGPDLVVMGHRGLGRVKRLLLGSVSNKVAQQADAAVLLVQ